LERQEPLRGGQHCRPATVTPDPGEALPKSVEFWPYEKALGWRIVSEPVARTLRFPRNLPRVG